MTKTKKLVLYGFLTAIIFLMAFTPLGYLRTAGLEITFIMIPVIVGAIMMGKNAGAILGGIFGLTSFFQAAFGASPFGATLFSIQPVYTFLLCMVPRILMGFLCGLFFQLLKGKQKPRLYAFALSSLSGALLNTLFFMTALLLMFGKSDYIQSMQGALPVFQFVLAFVGINGLVEALVCFVAGTAVSKAIYHYGKF